ncbi:hypothetical protein SDJN02_04737, partial [Cucurbita argyrosperma subsp. argyrosperma]
MACEGLRGEKGADLPESSRVLNLGHFILLPYHFLKSTKLQIEITLCLRGNRTKSETSKETGTFALLDLT